MRGSVKQASKLDKFEITIDRLNQLSAASIARATRVAKNNNQMKGLREEMKGKRQRSP